MASVVGRVASAGVTSADAVRRIACEELSTLPDPAVDEARVVAAAAKLLETAERWGKLGNGEELIVDWPERGDRRVAKSRFR